MDGKPNRSRPVRKALSFSEVEWIAVDRRMGLTNTRSFEEFARRAVLDNEIVVQRIAFDPELLKVELSRIGNNVNQIARHVNAEDQVTFQEMRAVKKLLDQIQGLIESAAGSVVEGQT
ncbi:MobC family plasmid mobilization relaxosome protein (plasmid) [Leifsonia sp. ZF2019]|uniref:MobC family plasmid mobilization relaxosome protein n=1 Tax=Leifsonia sp. ZF2019 TaxID=2781978 RepID=UPI001CBD8820|nr:MobC family plasmid mobilization relaxosome protein [Leifsonia sp. ZF2019]UAJ81717.1 MobC family plasmid mobilization relaxosome protein [Leifsonia sp. ZF2019]